MVATTLRLGTLLLVHRHLLRRYTIAQNDMYFAFFYPYHYWTAVCILAMQRSDILLKLLSNKSVYYRKTSGKWSLLH
jgi:hypothetical protein